jgi:hypothetical protein
MKNLDSKRKMMDDFRAFRAIRHSSFAIFLGFFCLFFAANSFAQSSNRWLFVFNTSASMRDRTNGMQAITRDLLTTAMHGTMRPGDTIGIWTYSDQLHADEAPLQTWAPNLTPAIAYNTVQFLRQHRYEKTAAFDDVLANMLRVIKISDVVTVILISDGSDSFQGTPFDAKIAAFYKTNSQAQKKAHMPIVTVFRGEKGTMTTNTFAVAPWPVEIPAVPPPPVVVQTVKKPEPVAPPKPVASLVIIGKKAETTFNPPSDLPEHVDQVTLPSATEQQAPAPAKVEVQTPVPEPAPKVEEKPAPAVAPVVTAPITAPPADSAPVAVVEPPKSIQPTEVQVTPAPIEPTAAKAVAPATPQVIEAATVPETNLFSVRNIAIVSVTFTLLICALLFLTARNARRASRASLITSSLDRERQ